ncbi:carbohydrate ABC transporter permease [Paenibacillus sabinae]|uniref:Binding-protein-dependent transport systems inner membrane component n=1 Tax=Paenibacillus sabinae T27 TaxID=1268072 RepID=X4ZVE9_9BACL|nr:carbohydrate ABC transporter permease [Paenibacillus sabinae]AHV95729.1 binding-protein-dependent transport systems inner membrane component [Paenibacillus sabinae T27]
MRLSDRLLDVVVYTLLAVLIAVTLYPLLYVLFASLSDGDRLLAHRGLLLKPLGFVTFAYERALSNPAVWTGYWNTIRLVAGGVVLNLILTILGAYVLSRSNVLWNKVLMIFVVVTMFFSGGMIPFYLVVKQLGLMNTLWALLLPFAVKTFHLIIMRTAFLSLPPSLEEAAQIDGAGHLTMLTRIVVPLSMPVIAVILLYTAVDKWNMWFFPSMFIQDRTLYPLQLMLREILINNQTDTISSGTGVGEALKIGETIKYATIIIATVPVLFVYPFLQRFFVKGALVGSIKG